MRSHDVHTELYVRVFIMYITDSILIQWFKFHFIFKFCVKLHVGADIVM